MNRPHSHDAPTLPPYTPALQNNAMRKCYPDVPAQHTPGPWTITRHNGNHGDSVYPSVIGVAGSNPYREGWRLPATVYQYNPQQAEADARLIAAAPELLRELRMLVMWIDEADKRHVDPPRPRDLRDARATIAKATGHP